MSTAPTGWQEPKTNWQANDPVGPGDLNRVEGNIGAVETGARTLDPFLAGAADTGTLRQILSWLAGRILAITGTTNWYEAPAATIATIWAKFSGSTGHKHTGGANDAPPIPLSGIESAAKTTAGGTEGNRLAVTNAGGAVGRADALKDGNGTYRTAAGPGGWGAGAAYRVMVTDANGRGGDSERLGGVSYTNYARTDQRPTFAAGIQDGNDNADVSYLQALVVPIHTRSLVATAWNAAGYPTTLEIRNGAAVLGTISITYNSANKPTQAVLTAGGKTVTVTQSFDAAQPTKFLSRSVGVV
ncbi:MAG: hypothetical protein ACOY93_13585 [Bacillota bacterium]